MARFKITPLYGEPFMVEADSRADARQKGHERMRFSKAATVIWRCEREPMRFDLSESVPNPAEVEAAMEKIGKIRRARPRLISRVRPGPSTIVMGNDIEIP